jgi:hypothetical protein
VLVRFRTLLAPGPSTSGLVDGESTTASLRKKFLTCIGGACAALDAYLADPFVGSQRSSSTPLGQFFAAASASVASCLGRDCLMTWRSLPRVGERRQEGQDAAIYGLGEIEVVAIEDLRRCAALVHALDDGDAVSHAPGERSHSDRTKMSPVPSSWIAFSNSGRADGTPAQARGNSNGDRQQSARNRQRPGCGQNSLQSRVAGLSLWVLLVR